MLQKEHSGAIAFCPPFMTLFIFALIGVIMFIFICLSSPANEYEEHLSPPAGYYETQEIVTNS